MDESIERMAHEIGSSFSHRGKRFHTAAVGIKWLLVLFSALATFLHFVVGEHWNAATYIGAAASGVVFLCGSLLLVIEQDSSAELEKARKAVEIARETERFYQNSLAVFREYRINQEQSNELYLAMAAMSNSIEFSLGLRHADPAQVVSGMLTTAVRSLRIACRFETSHHFTISVYRAESNTDPQINSKVILRCIAHDRSVPCPVENARAWPSGVGFAGYAFATGQDIIIPDLAAPEIGSGFAVPSVKETDRELYRSVAVYPIRVAGQDEPWGVALGTCDQPGHFSTGGDTGIRTSEAIRALAVMIALAVRALSVKHETHASSEQSAANPVAGVSGA